MIMLPLSHCANWYQTSCPQACNYMTCVHVLIILNCHIACIFLSQMLYLVLWYFTVSFQFILLI